MCDGIKLCGAKFVLMNECGKEIACAVTNECGELIFDCLPPGRYFIKEVQAPCGYVKSCECVEVLIDCKCMHRVVECVNRRESGSIKLIKYGI